MRYDDLREFLAHLESKAQLRRVRKEVDWSLELSYISKLNEFKKGPALLFENIKDYPGKRVAAGVLSSKERLALALGLDPESRFLDLANHWLVSATGAKVAPSWIDSGSQKHVFTDTDINLYDLPAPLFYPGDGGRYLSTAGCLISKNLRSGRINIGVYRGMIVDKNKMVQLAMPGRDCMIDLQGYAEMGKAMPVAWVTGVDPIIFLCAGSHFPSTDSEYEIAGAVRGEPVKVTKGKIVDLPIPAGAEIVLEGEVAPGELLPEGPFGEATGYYTGGGGELQEYLKVNAILCRDKPILWATTAGRPVSDTHMILALTQTASLWGDLRKMGILGIRGVHCPPTAMGRSMAVISIEQLYPGHATQVGLAAFASATGNHGLKVVIVVDEDIDPEDADQVLYALSIRCQPERGVQIIKRGTASLIDPSLPIGARSMTSRMLIDTGIPYEWQEKPVPVALDKGMKERIGSQWEEYFA